MNKDAERINGIIGKNGLNTSRTYTSLITYDLEKILSDYFEINGAPELIVEQNYEGYEIVVKFTASRVKAIVELPKY